MLKIILFAHAISAARHSIYAGILPTWISGDIFWPYFAGAVVSAIGLPPVLKEVLRARGFDRIPPFGRLFLAVPMAVWASRMIFTMPASLSWTSFTPHRAPP